MTKRAMDEKYLWVKFVIKNEMSVDETSVGEMSVGETSVNETFVDEMSVDETSCCRIKEGV
jgi:hypothetical protein